MPEWVRNYLVLPIVVGLTIASFTVVVPQFFRERTKLTYEMESPIGYPLPSGVEIRVNGIQVSKIVLYRFRLWNSGTLPIKGIPVNITFSPADTLFDIFSSEHSTTPPREFGGIEDLDSDRSSRRFRYELLNPGDQDIITVWTNSVARAGLYSKAAGMVVERSEASSAGIWELMGRTIPVFAGLLGLLGSLLSQVISRLRPNRSSRPGRE